MIYMWYDEIFLRNLKDSDDSELCNSFLRKKSIFLYCVFLIFF